MNSYFPASLDQLKPNELYTKRLYASPAIRNHCSQSAGIISHDIRKYSHSSHSIFMPTKARKENICRRYRTELTETNAPPCEYSLVRNTKAKQLYAIARNKTRPSVRKLVCHKKKAPACSNFSQHTGKARSDIEKLRRSRRTYVNMRKVTRVTITEAEEIELYSPGLVHIMMKS
ncbi:hypothetical protein PPYR_09679 [Photinus pyralis]|uniref:Uncharacterized protein n=1 Tax=Photinus pyralis TaxID=7054 RepID=A0A5N4AN06_PHOPY|nr:hypothetical protein PPYR_09679 [Photinus pyralis]